MESTLLWLGTIGGVLSGVCALVFGILAFRHAKAANLLAQDASDTAKRGEKLGADANNLAAESNRIAVDARQLAEEANTISTRAELRDTEVNDVRWVGRWEEPGRFLLTNRGEDEALRVKAAVTVDGEEATATADSVAGGESLVFDLPGARNQFHRERAEMIRYEQAVARGDFAVPYPVAMPNTILERVVWVTKLGKERVHDIKSHLDDLC
ncbi:hypothetical protein [Prescottella equi]|uniref:hypothetical protein n=1 Tax=Rhodococcus hoagii TaxID=43767 RepID=UPI000A115510|nr:hypothetical protein [Prescottella equi]ORM18308.1 hypothetical protein A5N74_11935 [Prescottella equi]